ncbi:MAG: SDR family oxidoreductase [Deltaproteobacteria bacterium]|nr:SDR family oxidoreductase [Deltaproteobacteria bacterium]
MTVRERIKATLQAQPRKWLVTGAAGFIGSALVEELLQLNQEVVGMDNFITGRRINLEDVRRLVGPERWGRFRFVEADLRDLEACKSLCSGVDYVLHQAALGSVPRSLDDPIATNQANVDGFVHMLLAARDGGVRRFVYAASSSTYGDEPALPKVEDRIGRPLSPYAVTKYVNELYADVFSRVYGMETMGLRYFNVFGRRQDPQGAYAAVIPRWIETLQRGEQPVINGDGTTSRDFCYVDNAVQANLLAALAERAEALNTVYNVACGRRTSLNDLFLTIRRRLGEYFPELNRIEARYGPFRKGDVLHSLADIGKAERLLGYAPEFSSDEGLKITVDWFVQAARG